MNHIKVYSDIIEIAHKNPPIGYCETHHIIPRCLGGTDDPSNLVDLSARAHFIVHILLAKIHGGKLVHAAWRMSLDGKHTSKKYEWLRRKHAEQVSIDMRGNQHGVSLKGIKRSVETRIRMSKPKSSQHSEAIRVARVEWLQNNDGAMKGEKNPFYGKKKTPEQIARSVEARQRNGSYRSALYREKMSIIKKSHYARITS